MYTSGSNYLAENPGSEDIHDDHHLTVDVQVGCTCATCCRKDHTPKGPGPGIQKNIFTLVCTAHSRSASRLLVMNNVHTADRVAHNEGNNDPEGR